MATTTNKKRTAADLISTKTTKALAFEPPSEEAAAQVAEILEYNDGATHNKRVPVREVLDLLYNDYGWSYGRYALHSWIVHRFGRQSWSKP
jgi:hypothetical protein